MFHLNIMTISHTSDIWFLLKCSVFPTHACNTTWSSSMIVIIRHYLCCCWLLLLVMPNILRTHSENERVIHWTNFSKMLLHIHMTYVLWMKIEISTTRLCGFSYFIAFCIGFDNRYHVVMRVNRRIMVKRCVVLLEKRVR